MDTLTDPLSHECRAGRTCLARTSTGAAVTKKPATLCHACIADIQRCQDDLPALQKALRAFIGKGTTAAWGETVSGSREPPAPLNVSVLDLIDEIGDVIFRDRGAVRDLVTQPETVFEVWRNDVQTLRSLDGVERALWIRSVHRRADKIVGLSHTWERKGAPCRHCGGFTLGGWSGTNAIHCTSCGAVMTRDDYEKMCIVRVASAP